MLRLYGHPFSRAHRVMWMLKELDLPFAHIPTGFLDGATRTPEHLTINPNGRVPALVDDGQAFFESLAINLYLASRYGAPLGIIDAGLATQWSFWVVTEVEKPLLFAAANLMLFAPEARRPDELPMPLAKLDRPFKVIDAHLAQRPYLLGDTFTVADVNVAGVLTLAALASVPLTAYPNLSRWLDECLARPAAADWKAIHFTVPRPADDKLMAMFL